MYKFCGVLIFLTVINLYAVAQTDSADVSSKQWVLSARAHYGFVFAHSVYIKNTADAKPRGFELEIAKQLSSERDFQYYRWYPRTGVMFTYTDFDKSFLGSGYSASYFLQPNYRLGRSASANLRGAVGFSYLTNPYDSVANKQNQTYSGHINVFLEVGVGVSVNISNKVGVTAGANFFHNSNSGIKQPNRGLNYPNISLAVNYYTASSRLPKYEVKKDTNWKDEPVHFEAGILYSPKTGYDIHKHPERKFLGGAMVMASKKIGNINAITLSAEAYYDGAMQSIKNNIIHDSTSCMFAGILAGHEFIFHKFIFSQQLGVHVFKKTDYYDNHYNDIYRTLYHRWGLRYAVTPHIYAGFNFLAHAQIADFVDVRVLYRF